MGWAASFLHSQFFVKPRLPDKDFQGQTIIVTGSNRGLGLEAARHLSRLNACLVILAVRDTSKGAAAKYDILGTTGRADNSIKVWLLDLHSYASIETFCVKAQALPRLDAVIENAGIMTKHFNMAAGYESTIATNVIGTFLLAFGLLPKLRQTAMDYKIQPRLSFVTSDTHIIAKFPERQSDVIFAELNKSKPKLTLERYSTSKLIQVLCIRELASLVSTWPFQTIIINCLTPGFCSTGLDPEGMVAGKYIRKMSTAFFARTAEAGSRTLVTAIAAGNETQGAYMADGHISRPGRLVLGEGGLELQKRVWHQLVNELERIQPGISLNLS
ncbi:hypothetical protein BJ878DRAFT_462549 [Calycina marina]|uniref:Short-chain dehydrogenase/reductase n=1 Tax=Calycina marina TaxID=1763456 RepID=A0A9P7Z112_9HELO|nr:hypothetical protein BJ878DRAFT_462549 [Calycina marina]